MQRTNIYLPDEQIAALDAVATARGVSRAELVRDYIQRGLSAASGSIDEDLAAIDASFGVLGADLDSFDRGAGERERHLERLRSR